MSNICTSPSSPGDHLNSYSFYITIKHMSDDNLSTCCGACACWFFGAPLCGSAHRMCYLNNIQSSWWRYATCNFFGIGWLWDGFIMQALVDEDNMLRGQIGMSMNSNTNVNQNVNNITVQAPAQNDKAEMMMMQMMMQQQQQNQQFAVQQQQAQQQQAAFMGQEVPHGYPQAQMQGSPHKHKHQGSPHSPRQAEDIYQ